MGLDVLVRYRQRALLHLRVVSTLCKGSSLPCPRPHCFCHHASALLGKIYEESSPTAAAVLSFDIATVVAKRVDKAMIISGCFAMLLGSAAVDLRAKGEDEL